MTSQLPSPFATKLGTNYCPSDAEILDIQRFLLAPLSRLKHLNDRIAELQKAIDQKLRYERGGGSGPLGSYLQLMASHILSDSPPLVAASYC
ncbi:hypothetical protein C8R46DRAFT_1220099 [Mycena filopes]|nr:hypothetical protein C8R46DRAFT_1220099 [Mycena filopes]